MAAASEKKTTEPPKLLDADVLIDEILATKGPRKYKDGLTEDKWEEELENIPLFMTTSPSKIDDEKAPVLAAIRDLKYETDTPDGRAACHKEEGNHHFRGKKYPEAIEEYSAGLREGGTNVALRAVLYTNRAAAQFHLGNLRSCLKDVKEAKKIKPDHLKALHRGAVVCLKLRLFQEAIGWCDEGLLVAPEDAQLKELRLQAARDLLLALTTNGRDTCIKTEPDFPFVLPWCLHGVAGHAQAYLKRQERDRRRQARAMREKELEKQKLLDAIKSRNIELASSVSLDNDGDDEDATPTMELVLEGSHPSGEKVHLDPEGGLVWPVMFLYPEHGQSDLIAAFHEDHRFLDHLEMMFGGDSRPVWDKLNLYTPSTIQIYYEDGYSCELVPVQADSTLRAAISRKGYVVGGGTPAFFLLAGGSSFTQHFLNRSRSSQR